MEPIHASEALDEMHKQEQTEEDSVFPEGSTGKPETEAADQKPSTHESVIEIQASETKTEQPARSAAENTAADRKQNQNLPQKRKSYGGIGHRKAASAGCVREIRRCARRFSAC